MGSSTTQRPFRTDRVRVGVGASVKTWGGDRPSSLSSGLLRSVRDVGDVTVKVRSRGEDCDQGTRGSGLRQGSDPRVPGDRGAEENPRD